MNAIATIKNKTASFACNPKVYGAVTKLTNGLSAVAAGASALVLTAVNSSAVDWGSTITAEAAIAQISDGCSDFIEPAIIIMCAVAGLRLGMKFLRGAAK